MLPESIRALTPNLAVQQSSKSKMKTSSSTSSSISTSKSSPKGTTHSPNHSVGSRSARHGSHSLLSQSSGEEADSDTNFSAATSRSTCNRTVRGQQKDKDPAACAVNHVQNYSFGKRENIISGREPKLPRSLLEGRFSDRMLQVKGRTYNEEDWFDDSRSEKQIISKQA